MIGPLDGEPPGAARHGLADEVVAAACERQADRVRLGPADQGIGPAARQGVFEVRVAHRIGAACAGLVADHRLVAGGVADLPETRVAGEDRPVATGLDETVDRVAHPPGPVLVVAGCEQQPLTVEYARFGVEVGVDGVIEFDALAVGPLGKTALPVEPPGRSRPQRDLVIREILREALMLRVVLADVRDAQVVAVVIDRAGDVSDLERSPERHLAGAAVQTLAAPLVVRLPRVGAEVQQRRRTIWSSMTYHHERLRDIVRSLSRPQLDLVEAGSPRRFGRDRQRHRPVATRAPRVFGHGMVGDRRSRAPDDLAGSAEACDLDVDRRNATRTMQVDGIAGDDALARGVPLDRRPAREVSVPHAYVCSRSASDSRARRGWRCRPARTSGRIRAAASHARAPGRLAGPTCARG